jgi:hypothetical protein
MQEVIHIPGQPCVFISDGHIVNGAELRAYWYRRHRRENMTRDITRSLKVYEPEAEITPPIQHVVVYEHSDTTDKNLQRIGQLELDVRRLKEKPTYQKKREDFY